MNNEKRAKNKIFSAFPVGLKDLMFGEKSPAIIAIAINLAITAIIWIPGIIIFSSKLFEWQDQSSIFKTSAILAVAIAMIISANLILICAAIAQVMLLIKTRKPQLWASATVATVILLPMVIAVVSSVSPENNHFFWLFSPFPAIALPFASITTILSTIIAQWGILAILSLQLTRQLRKIGESASKAMLTTRPSLPSGS
jgi:phosphoglycerol transferase MdoB-like AlkP superfamily enzyme